MEDIDEIHNTMKMREYWKKISETGRTSKVKFVNIYNI